MLSLRKYGLDGHAIETEAGIDTTETVCLPRVTIQTRIATYVIITSSRPKLVSTLPLGLTETGKLIEPAHIKTTDGGYVHKRLLVIDQKTGTRFLVNTGADVSVLPKAWAKNAACAERNFMRRTDRPLRNPSHA